LMVRCSAHHQAPHTTSSFPSARASVAADTPAPPSRQYTMTKEQQRDAPGDLVIPAIHRHVSLKKR
jgi:hypothetical protein